MNEIEGVEDIGTNRTTVDTEMQKVGEFDEHAKRAVALFYPQPYIPQENMLVIVEDSTLTNCHISFALATSITHLEDRKKLEAIKTQDLESLSFQCLTTVSSFLFLHPVSLLPSSSCALITFRDIFITGGTTLY